MGVKFRKQAIKFLQRANTEDVENIREQIRLITIIFEEQKIIPFTELDIKKMKGDWEGFYRLRVGKNRVIFTVNFNSNDIIIYAIGTRSDIYKK